MTIRHEIKLGNLFESKRDDQVACKMIFTLENGDLVQTETAKNVTYTVVYHWVSDTEMKMLLTCPTKKGGEVKCVQIYKKIN